MTTTRDPVREAEELREQLCSDRRRVLIFIGADTSQAVGIDGAVQLTANIRSDLAPRRMAHYDRFSKTTSAGAEPGQDRRFADHCIRIGTFITVKFPEVRQTSRGNVFLYRGLAR